MRSARWDIAAALVLLGHLFVGLGISDDYGVSWDEEINRGFGFQTLEYVQAKLAGDSHAVEVAAQFHVAEQGPFFELVLAALEAAFGPADSRGSLLFRHRVTFVTFWVGMVAFFFLLRRLLRDPALAALGTLLLILQPRTFADSFYNSKDTVLLSLFVISTLTLVLLLRTRTWWMSVLHALACAAVIDVRLVGLLLPAVTLLVFGIDLAARRCAAADVAAAGRAGATYLIALALFVVLLWPQLWESPVARLVETAGRLGQARQLHNSFALFGGTFVSVADLPWDYLPRWMAITIPPPVLLLFLLGAVLSWHAMVGAPLDPAHRGDWILQSLLWLPVCAVVVVRPLLYDGWRHLYFVYPALIGVAMIGLDRLRARSRVRAFGMGLALLAAAHCALIVVRLHPYQQVYFNSLAGSDVEGRYELDYWGLSFREGLEAVLDLQPSGIVPVAVSDVPGELNRSILEPERRSRIRIVPLEQARYFLSNHRNPWHFERFRSGAPPYVNEVYRVEAGGACLLGVYESGRPG